MEKMTDNEILKALECCGTYCCNECSYYNDDLCIENMSKQVVDLINRQKAEIEKYEHIKATINKFWNTLLKLKLAKRKEAPTLEEFAEAIGEIESEAIKEFAEKVKKYFPSIAKAIDDIAKEMDNK